jgi:hypothetical protein
MASTPVKLDASDSRSIEQILSRPYVYEFIRDGISRGWMEGSYDATNAFRGLAIWKKSCLTVVIALSRRGLSCYTARQIIEIASVITVVSRTIMTVSGAGSGVQVRFGDDVWIELNYKIRVLCKPGVGSFKFCTIYYREPVTRGSFGEVAFGSHSTHSTHSTLRAPLWAFSITTPELISAFPDVFIDPDTVRIRIAVRLKEVILRCSFSEDSEIIYRLRLCEGYSRVDIAFGKKHLISKALNVPDGWHIDRDTLTFIPGSEFFVGRPARSCEDSIRVGMEKLFGTSSDPSIAIAHVSPMIASAVRGLQMERDVKSYMPDKGIREVLMKGDPRWKKWFTP